MYRVTLKSRIHDTAVVVLSSSPYPDETREWLEVEAWNEEADARNGPARRALARLTRRDSRRQKRMRLPDRQGRSQ